MSKNNIDSEVRAWRKETLKPFSEAAIHFGIPFSEARRIYTQDAKAYNHYMFGANTDNIVLCAVCKQPVDDPKYKCCSSCREKSNEKVKRHYERKRKEQAKND